MTSFGLVRTWRSAPLTIAGVAATAVAANLEDHLARLARAGFDAAAAGGPPGVRGGGWELWSGSSGSSGWSGPAAEAAAERHQAVVLDLARLAAAATTLRDAVTLAATRVASAETLADQAATCAGSGGGRLDDDGRFHDLGADPGAAGLIGRSGRSAALDLADLAETLAARAVAEAELADASLASALRGLDPALSALSALSAPVPPSALAPVAANAAQRLAWWHSLGPDAQQEAVAAQPDVVGSTDGIPAWARDRANRIRLGRAQRELSARAGRLGPGLPVSDPGTARAAPDPAADRAAYRQLRGDQEALAAVAQVLDARDGHARQLLVLDLAGPAPRAAVAVGDVDHADHVAVVVPGFTTTVARDLVGSDRLSTDLADLARREAMGWGDRGDVAVVSWLGYDAPQVADTLRAHSVVLRASAQEGAETLAPFLRGLPPAAHLTVVAHSYGSTTAGLALAQGGSGVDDLVAIGSPGLGVGTTAPLGLAARRVHVLEAADDAVADLGWFGPDPSRLPGVDRPSTEASVLPDGSRGRRSVGHSTYLAAGTTSQWNIAAVVVGRPATAGRPPATTSW